VQADDQETAWGYVEALAKIVLPFVVGITTINSPRDLRLLAWTVLLSQAYVCYELNMTYLGGFNRLLESGFGGFDNNCNAIAMCAAVGLAFFLGLHAPKLWQMGLAMGSAAVIGHAILLSFSRGGMLGLIFVGAASVILIPKKPKHYAALAAGVLLALYFTGPQLAERFMTIFSDREQLDRSATSRLELWWRCVDTMFRDPVLGVGPQHWHLIVEKRYNWDKAQEAHSLWLQTGAELGIPGMLFLVLFYATCMAGCGAGLWHLQRNSPQKMPALDVPLARGVVAALVGFVVSAQFVSVQHLELPFYIALIGAGVLKLATPPESRGGVPGAAAAWRRVVPVFNRQRELVPVANRHHKGLGREG
jgi:O-antigen ligase